MKLLTVSDMSKRPFHNSELDDAGPQCCNNLAEEHHSLGNLEIMSEFQVVEKCVSLVHGDVAVCLEQHHRHRPSWLHITDNIFGEDV